MNTMKMKVITALTGLLMLTVACSKKDDNLPLSKQNLLGKWNIISDRTVIKNTSGGILSDATNNNYPNCYFDFRANDSVYQRTYDDDTLKYDTLHYTIANNQILLTYKDSEQNIGNVKQLTKNKLIVSEVIEDEYNNQPASFESIFTFNR